MLKAIATLAVAITLSAPAWADWVEVSKTDAFVFYVDPSTIRKNGNFRKVWVIQDMKRRRKDGEMSTRSLPEYDCKDELSRTLWMSSHSEHMAGGKVLVNSKGSEEWRPIPPGSVNDDIFKFVCDE